MITFNFHYCTGLSNETVNLVSEELNKTEAESALLCIILILACVLSLSVITSLYLEISKKAVERSTGKGVLLGKKIVNFLIVVIIRKSNRGTTFLYSIFYLVLGLSTAFTTSNCLQKFGYYSCAPWQLLVFRGIFQIFLMMICRSVLMIQEFRHEVINR